MFLLVRRGVPAVSILLLLMLITLKSSWQIWYFIGIIALLIEITLTFIKGRAYLKNRSMLLGWDKAWASTLRPIIRCIGAEENWLLSFCHWNNYRIQQAFQFYRARRVLLLLPHCIQIAQCSANILHDLNKCYNCGLCNISSLLPLQDKYNLKSCINNRSHKAYQYARQYKPDLIIAIGCLDRLFKGLIRLSEIPSYIIPLDLKHGMCINTNFNIDHLVTAIDALVEARRDNINNIDIETTSNQIKLASSIGIVNLTK